VSIESNFPGSDNELCILRLSCKAAIAEDLSGRRSEALSVEIAPLPNFTFSEDRNWVEGEVQGGSIIEFSVTTSEYPDHLSIIIQPIGELREVELTEEKA
jgi:hypothetical protein